MDVYHLQYDQIGRFFALWVTFLKPLASINLPKSPTFLGIFVKVSKSFIFLVKSFWETFIDIWRFLSGHTDHLYSMACHA